MNRPVLDPRQKHIGILKCLGKRRIEKMKELAGRQGAAPNIKLFEDVIWWWRPLEEILAKHGPFDAVEKNKIGFFPKKVFSQLQFAFLTGDMRKLTFLWTGAEIGARVQQHPIRYPAFLDNRYMASDMIDNPDWRAWRKAALEVDLGQTKENILKEAGEKIEILRQRLFLKTRHFTTETPKSRTFEADSFRACELIDVKMFGLPWKETQGKTHDGESQIRRALRVHLKPR